MIYVIVPFSRPNYIDNVIYNFHSQNYNDKKLIIIENGRAIGTCKKRNIQPDVLLSSDNHQSWAKNEGIEWIRKHGGGWWTTFDDDDYYGEGYLSKISKCFDKAEIIGQLDIFMKTIANTIRLFSNLGENKYVNGVHGSTITARAEDCPLFKNTGKWGEDWKFIEDYTGARCWATSPYYHLLNRHMKNTWQVSDDSMVRRLSFSSSGECIVKDFGQCNDKSYDIIDGKLKTNLYSKIDSNGDITLKDSLAYEELMKTSKTSDELASEWFANNIAY